MEEDERIDQASPIVQPVSSLQPSSKIIPDDVTLYWMSGQLASWKVRIALEEKQLQGYRTILVIRPEQFDRSDEFWMHNEYGIVREMDLSLLHH